VKPNARIQLQANKTRASESEHTAARLSNYNVLLDVRARAIGRTAPLSGRDPHRYHRRIRCGRRPRALAPRGHAPAKRVILLKAGGPAYWPLADAIALRAEVVQTAEVPLLRILSCMKQHMHGSGQSESGTPSKDRARIERQCVDAELRLARLLPDATELEECAREKLSRKW